ncbi:hypothetical protein D7I43_05680 [Micromonospora globbae]|uniref:Uncharacterized protein n=1 Tax=Micromonospora globbae TaxID=1894969 RepID=A0A420F6F1_9ACTN|nr:hypothetical protein D7I43_05680 [Micromonospora globbae]
MNPPPSTEVHTAAPSARAPTISQPAGPPTTRAALTARGPPNRSNGAGTSRNAPPDAWIQLLVRGFPCTPPVAAPSAANRASRHAAAYSSCCRP